MRGRRISRYTRNVSGAAPPVLAIDGLQITFATDHGPVVAVRDLSLAVADGETVALVGESGSGKSVT